MKALKMNDLQRGRLIHWSLQAFLDGSKTQQTSGLKHVFSFVKLHCEFAKSHCLKKLRSICKALASIDTLVSQPKEKFLHLLFQQW